MFNYKELQASGTFESGVRNNTENIYNLQLFKALFTRFTKISTSIETFTLKYASVTTKRKDGNNNNNSIVPARGVL